MRDMTDFRDVMLDLETYGTGRDAAIASIGAVRFDLLRGDVGELARDRFHVRVDLTISKSPGVLTASTVEWWLKQPDAARRQLVAGNRISLNDAVVGFAMWVGSRGDANVWGCGANFDEVVLGDAFARHGQAWPFKFWRSRCFRTLKELGSARGIREPMRAGTHHDAMDDALHQARWACEVWRQLRGEPVGSAS